MGARSGGGAGGGGGMTGDANYKGKITKVESLVKMKDRAMYKATGEAISRYHSVMGVRERNVKLAEMGDGVYGAQATAANGQTAGIYLNSKYFKGSNAKKEMTGRIASEYKSGWQTATNKPVAHVVTHELAHATWNSHLSSANAKAATPAVKKLYKSWSADSKKSGYGKYSKTNINEFWAEVCTKAVHGKADRYTRAAKGIVRKYSL